MKREIIQIKVPRLKRRAWELYDADSPYRGRAERSKKEFRRRPKHQKGLDQDSDWC